MTEKEKPYEAAGKHIKFIRLSLYKGDKPHTVNAATKEINGKAYLCRANEIGKKPLTQVEFAKYINIPAITFQNYELGTRMMKSDTAEKVATFVGDVLGFEVSPYYFQGDEWLEKWRYEESQEMLRDASEWGEDDSHLRWEKSAKERKTFFAALSCQYDDIRHNAEYDFMDAVPGGEHLAGPNRFKLHTDDGKPTYLSDAEMQQVVDALANTLAFELFKIERKRNAKK